MSRGVAFVGPNIVTLVVFVVIVVAGAHALEMGKSHFQTWQENSQQWCTDHGGELEETLAGGGMSGLKCTLPSGKAVDMGEVSERGYPANVSVVPAYGTAPYDGAYSNLWKNIPTAAGVAVVVCFLTTGWVWVRDRVIE